MTINYGILLFSYRSLFSHEGLVWLLGGMAIVVSLLLLVHQWHQMRGLKHHVRMLRDLKMRPVEYDLVLRVMRLAVWRVDVATRRVTIDVDFRNNDDQRLMSVGISIDEVAAKFGEKYRADFLNGIDDVIAGREDTFYMQYEVCTPENETLYWAEIYVTIESHDSEGRPQSLVGITRRIDEQKQIENVLMEAVYQAEESDRLKSAFLANISHEIRTPLNAIVGFSEVLTAVDNWEEREKLIKLIHDNNDTLLRLFDDVVSLSRLEARGGGQLQVTTFPLVEVFRELQEKYKQQSESKGIPIVIADEASLPQLTTDRDRIREIINQYINNALKFTGEGCVTLGSDVQNGHRRIWVRDTGKGIPADKCNDRLFERFVKVDEFAQGTGLGLSICRTQAKMLGGEVGVSSELGKGSLFWITIDE